MKKLELYWDVGSPYTYLAITQLPDLIKRTGAQVELMPFLLGGVFKGANNRMPAEVPAKAMYLMQDLVRWRDHYKVPLKIPPSELVFPVNSLLAMRVAIFAKRQGKGDEYCRQIFKAYWAEGRDVGLQNEVEAAASASGLDPAAAIAGASEQSVKDELRKNTEDAVARGAFGAPAMFIGEQLFWGNDRLDFVERALLSS